MRFHTFTLPEDRCALLLVKNLGRGKPESVAREELETLGFMSRVSRNCVPAVVNMTPPRTALPPPLHCISGARARGVLGALNHRTLRPASVGGVVLGSKWPYAMQALPALRTHAGKLRLRASVRPVWRLPPVRWVLNPTGTDSVLWLWG